MDPNTLFSFKCAGEHLYMKADTPAPVEMDIFIEAYLKDELRANPGLLCNTHFILILDISGSMDDYLEDDKTKLQAVIEAASHILTGIKPGDLISIITFTNKERIFCWGQPAHAKEQLIAKLNDIYNYPRGATNLAPALQAAKINLDKMQAQMRDMATKLLILTDGKIHDVDTGEILAKEFQERGIDIDTLGIGADFHGEDMERLTSGFMDKLENTTQTISVFEKRLRVLQNTVATKVKIELDPTEGVEIWGIAKVSPDIKLLPHGTRIISLENVDRNRRYVAVVRILVDPAPIGEKALMTCTLSFDIPKKGIVDETIERVVAVEFTNDPNKYTESLDSEVIHASTYYTIAMKAQEIQDNSDNKELIMRNLKVIINLLKKIGDLETMMRWEAVKEDYIQKGEFSLEEYNKIAISKSKTSTSFCALPPPVHIDLDDELAW